MSSAAFEGDHDTATLRSVACLNEIPVMSELYSVITVDQLVGANGPQRRWKILLVLTHSFPQVHMIYTAYSRCPKTLLSTVFAASSSVDFSCQLLLYANCV